MGCGGHTGDCATAYFGTERQDLVSALSEARAEVREGRTVTVAIGGTGIAGCKFQPQPVSRGIHDQPLICGDGSNPRILEYLQKCVPDFGRSGLQIASRSLLGYLASPDNLDLPKLPPSLNFAMAVAVPVCPGVTSTFPRDPCLTIGRRGASG